MIKEDTVKSDGRNVSTDERANFKDRIAIDVGI